MAAPRGERGGVLGCLLWIVLLGAAGYVGFRFAAPYFQYWRFKDAMSTQAETAEINTDPEIRKVLTQAAADLDIPLEAGDIKVRRGRRAITISAAWTKEVVLPKYRRTLSFHPQVVDTLAIASP